MSLRYTSARTAALVSALAVVGWLLVAGHVTAAGRAPGRAGRTGNPAISTSVRGVAWNSDNSPVPAAKVRLRNLQTGRVEGSAVTSEIGQFTFSGLESGAYVIELVSDGGRVMAVGQGFRVESGETVATFVRLPARQSWFGGAFSNAAAAVIAAASSAGVTAIGSPGPPVSPQ
jgi:carboxypeptidase family protein